MKMMEKKIRDSFRGEWDIPDSVDRRMREAYRQIGAEDAVAARRSRGAAVGRNRGCFGKRYARAAVFAAAVLLIGTSVGAATGKLDLLTKLFHKDAGLAVDSSSMPESTMVKNGSEYFKYEIESISGTEEMIYVIVRVQRTDGKTFDKDAYYKFADQQVNDKDSFVGKGGDEFLCSGSFMLENEGTSQLRIGVTSVYERKSRTGEESFYQKGRCDLLLGDLIIEGENGETLQVVSEGETDLSFVRDYGEAATKTKKTNLKISLPISGTDQYDPQGMLREVTITPYYVKWVHRQAKRDVETEPDTWGQVYVEMDDGRLMGYVTKEDDEARYDLGGSNMFCGNGEFIEREKVMEYTWWCSLPELIDVEHVRAVYIGKTRIAI